MYYILCQYLLFVFGIDQSKQYATSSNEIRLYGEGFSNLQSFSLSTEQSTVKISRI